MDDRLYFHSLLETFFPSLNLYYRPPSKLLIKYPCIVYQDFDYRAIYSDNKPYVVGTTYRATIMSELPGFTESRKMLEIKNSKFIKSFTSNDIVHDVFEISIKSI